MLKHSRDVGDKNKDVTTLEWNRDGTLLATGESDSQSVGQSVSNFDRFFLLSRVDRIG